MNPTALGSYKGVTIKPGSDQDIQAQIRSIDSSGSTISPAVITSKPAQKEVDDIISQHKDLTSNMANQTAVVSANKTQREAQAMTEAERQAKIKETEAQLAQKREELRLKQAALAGEDASIEAKTLSAEEQAIKDATAKRDQVNLDLETEQKKVFDALTRVIEGTFPLNAGEQAQIDGLKNQYAQLIANQKLANITDSGLANVRGYQKGSAEYDPTFQAKTIGSIVTGGVNKIADLESKAAIAVAELTNAIQSKKYDQISGLWKSYSEAKNKQAEAFQKVIDETNKAIEDSTKKQEGVQKEIDNVLATAIKNGADTQTLNAIRSSRTREEALINAGQFLQSENEILDTIYKRAQIDKIYSEMSGDEQQYDPSEIIAYANQYASTGSIPTGLPKGSFGLVSQVAKELPKSAGQIVSSSTGVKPTTNQTLQEGLGALYSAIDLASQLKELDNERWGGFLAGSIGGIVGSESQQRYVDLRSQIIDLLSRARSGAALTTSEEARYGNMLPGRFDEPFGFGADSNIRIDNFIRDLTSDLTNKSRAQGWAVYGMSSVNVGGQKYLVGDIIQNANGDMGRVNADGSITLIEQ